MWAGGSKDFEQSALQQKEKKFRQVATSLDMPQSAA